MMSKKRLWQILLATLLLTSLTLTACGGAGTEEAAPVEAPATMEGELEIYSWWAGDEGPALEALISEYNTRYPDVEVINATVAGGSGVEAK
ncbi:MAG: carbohydrate ABC transporter substrate-binding protein, partial [Anaerolineales bacterium]|nr:carbohydrate ABC transporter substrate-binding protein [Anaerolineales bacterium]